MWLRTRPRVDPTGPGMECVYWLTGKPHVAGVQSEQGHGYNLHPSRPPYDDYFPAIELLDVTTWQQFMFQGRSSNGLVYPSITFNFETWFGPTAAGPWTLFDTAGVVGTLSGGWTDIFFTDLTPLFTPTGPVCPYGTRLRLGKPVTQFITTAFIRGLATYIDNPWLANFVTPLIGTFVDLEKLCGQGPPTIPPLDASVLLQTYKYSFPILGATIWDVFCECVPGTPPPRPPDAPVIVRGAGVPDDNTITTNPTNPCLDIAIVRRQLEDLSRIVGFDLQVDQEVQRQLAPAGYVLGASHSGFSGAGSFAIGELVGVQVNITSPFPGRILEGQPAYLWDLGWMSIMTADGMIQEKRITRQAEVWLVPLFTLATTFGYFLKDGVTATFHELIALP